MWDLWWTKWHWDRFFTEFFSFSLSVSLFHQDSIFILPSSGGRTIGPLVAAVQRYSLTPSKK
jgi:hypothetical protein